MLKEAEPADYPNILRVQVLNPGEDNIAKTLGITEERQDFLLKQINEIGLKSDTLSEFMALISKKVDNAAELAFANFQIGVVMGMSKGEAAKKKDKK